METLNDRIAGVGSSRIAFVGLAQKAGKTTALRHVIAGLAERGVPVGVAAAGMRDEDLEAAGGPATLLLDLREGTIVATTAPAAERSQARLETLQRVDCSTSIGQLIVARATQPGQVEVIGPGTGPDLRRAVAAIRAHTQGPILIESSLTRKGFSAPDVADHLVLAVGAGLAPSVDRLVPAIRFYLDLFGAPIAPPPAAALFERASSEGRCIVTTTDWKYLDSFHWRVSDNAPSLLGRRDVSPGRAIVPHSITDDIVIPLLREGMKINLVVRDPMRNALSPVYNAAWEKRGGGVSVIHRPKILAVVVNPVNPTGPDFDPPQFLSDLSKGLSEVSLHDVVAEAQALHPKKRWFRR